MYFVPCMYPVHCPYYMNMPTYEFTGPPVYGTFSQDMNGRNVYATQYDFESADRIPIKDYGAQPFVVNINEAAKQNNTYRTALWTGPHLQVTLMSINVGDDIGLEVHPDNDQFLRIEQGQGVVRMGPRQDRLTFERQVMDDSAIMVPAGTWHNVINTGNVPLKLYAIYAPPHHPFGTVHATKEIAMAEED